MYISGFGAHGFDVEDEATHLNAGCLRSLYRDFITRRDCGLCELILAQG